MQSPRSRPMRLALYQPDIPQNAGALMRLSACMGVSLDLIGPCGFVLDDRGLSRVAMDYREHLDLTVHASWPAFLEAAAWRRAGGRLVLLSTRARTPYTDHRFSAADTILAGRESAGVPEEVFDAADARLCIPLRPGPRSLNVAVAAAMVLGEALRQTNTMPEVGA